MVYFRPILNENGITEQQWRVIRVLVEHGDLEPRELCVHCCILSPSMAGILKRMEEMGLIRKIPLEDQRRLIVKLTAKAHRLSQTVTQQTALMYERIEQKIGSEGLSELYATLDKVLNRLDS